MATKLKDDGTFDTVICCTECGEEQRYNWEPDSIEHCEETYDEFVAWAIEDFDESHVCEEVYDA